MVKKERLRSLSGLSHTPAQEGKASDRRCSGPNDAAEAWEGCCLSAPCSALAGEPGFPSS